MLSARGALMSDLTSEYAAALFTGSRHFDHERAEAVLASLRGALRASSRSRSGIAAMPQIEFIAEARYRHQVWQLDVPLCARATSARRHAVDELVEDFHAIHEEVYAVRDERAVVEVVNLRARVDCPLPAAAGTRHASRCEHGRRYLDRDAHASTSAAIGTVNAAICGSRRWRPASQLAGPAIVESSFTTVVLQPRRARRAPSEREPR